MGTVLVVDGSDVCRAPIVEFVLGRALGPESPFGEAQVRSRGLAASPGATMCESASGRLGFSGSAIAFFGAHRAAQLSADDIRDADLVLTAERAQRSSVVRMLPGTQASVFTWKEALVLATVLADRIQIGSAAVPPDLPALARALHACRGTVPLIEPAVRTGVFHWRRPADTDLLTIPDGHDGVAQHRQVTQETFEVASSLAMRFAEMDASHVPAIDREADTHRAKRWRQRA